VFPMACRRLSEEKEERLVKSVETIDRKVE
jgi:hypothetical protein